MTFWFYIAIPVLVTIVGSVVATFRTVPDLVRSGLQHFTAGVVFAALAGELLPDVLHRQAPIATVLGFVAGVAVMFGMRRWTGHLEGDDPSTSKPVSGLLLAVGVDALLDGLVIGISFTAGQTVGILVPIALSLEMFFLGVTTALSLRARGVAAGRASMLTCGLALLIAVGAGMGLTVFAGASNAVLAGTLAFGCAALLYLVTEELLVEAHSVEETPLVTSLFFAGFLTILVVEMAL